mmetsp:Transcript_29959/g.29149  ORF Transcript_29959/g.29149 Transcript_29959/m.29149 type:complete len:213 (+) Transcript_29959:668-1306(+)
MVVPDRLHHLPRLSNVHQRYLPLLIPENEVLRPLLVHVDHRHGVLLEVLVVEGVVQLLALLVENLQRAIRHPHQQRVRARGYARGLGVLIHLVRPEALIGPFHINELTEDLELDLGDLDILQGEHGLVREELLLGDMAVPALVPVDDGQRVLFVLDGLVAPAELDLGLLSEGRGLALPCDGAPVETPVVVDEALLLHLHLLPAHNLTHHSPL